MVESLWGDLSHLTKIGEFTDQWFMDHGFYPRCAGNGYRMDFEESHLIAQRVANRWKWYWGNTLLPNCPQDTFKAEKLLKVLGVSMDNEE